MSEHTPITGELREAVEWEPTFCGPDRAMVPQPEFDSLCDAIDAVHAGLERENAELRAKLDNMGESMHDGWIRKDKKHVISHATVEVMPHIDWSRMADELDEFVEIVRGMAGGAE